MFPLRLSSLRIKSRYTAYTFSPRRHPFFPLSLPLRIKYPMSKVERSFEKQKFSNYLAPEPPRFYLFNIITGLLKILIGVIIVRAISSTRKEREDIYIYIYTRRTMRLTTFPSCETHGERERERVGVVNGENGEFARRNRGGKTVTETVLDEDKYIGEVL